MVEWRYYTPGWFDDYGTWRADIELGGASVLRLEVDDGALGECVALVSSLADWHSEIVRVYDECDDVSEAKRIAVALACEALTEVKSELSMESASENDS